MGVNGTAIYTIYMRLIMSTKSIGRVVFCKRRIDCILACETDDQNRKYVIASDGTQAMYVEPKSPMKSATQQIL